MAQYQKIVYRIGKDGKITETVVGASGSTCTQTTAEIEKALGQVTSQELLPEYYTEPETLSTETNQYLGEDYRNFGV